MITRLTLRNFKSIGDQTYDFTQFDLLVGRNNSGKSTVLQALAIWQFCVDEFHRAKRTGTTGIQIVLPNFTALPVPEFNLLWKDKTERAYPADDKGKRKQKFILIDIIVEWSGKDGQTESFGVHLRYHTPQTIYAIPEGGWNKFKACKDRGDLPKVAYVPPFSGLEPTERWLDEGPLRQQVGKAQPGSVLRNLLVRVCPSPWGADGKIPSKHEFPVDWVELCDAVSRWFAVTMRPPEYGAGDVHILVQYLSGSERYDIIAGGSGFHQTLTLLAFLYGYQPTTILLDEPDAHLHVNLQREILDYFKRKAIERGTQFLIATHAEEFVKGVDASQIVSLLTREPKRIASTPAVLQAMSEVSNEDVALLMASPFILYVEGESDARILRAWALQCGAQDAIDKVVFKTMNGGGKSAMKERADAHFAALKQIIPGVERLMLFDFDSASDAFHPKADNPALAEWKRKNIENYLLVPDAWKRAVLRHEAARGAELFMAPVLHTIDTFFSDQNLTLPASKTWRNVAANVFAVVDGKRMLFESPDSLFHQLKAGSPSVHLIRDNVAMVMTPDEIHEDVHHFMAKLQALTRTSK